VIPGARYSFRHPGPVPGSTGTQAQDKRLDGLAVKPCGPRHKAGVTMGIWQSYSQSITVQPRSAASARRGPCGLTANASSAQSSAGASDTWSE